MAIGAVVTTLTIVFAMISFMDFDGDGLANITEFQLGTAVNNPDTDGDGLNDGAEVNIYGTSPLLADTDGDGLSDGVEVNTYGTNPILPDTDNDGLGDGLEVNVYKTNPLNADTDNDNLSDDFEVFISGTGPLLPDTDNDGLLDGPEISIYGTNPLSNDTDNDRLSDSLEINGWPITVNGSTVKVTSDSLVKDSDGDNLSDWAEYNTYGSDPRRTDTDGDGGSDILEVLYNTDLSEASSVPQLKENAPTYPRLYLEIDYMSGYTPSADAISYIESYFKYSLGVVVEVAHDEITSSELTAIGVSPDSLSTQKLVSIEQHFHDNLTTHLYVFYASALDGEEAGGLASNSYGAALNGTYISGNIARERTVLLHEVGHCLGLEHCDNSICAMQVVAIFENPIYCNSSWSQRNLLNIWSVDEPWT
jgi:hypothetical protein